MKKLRSAFEDAYEALTKEYPSAIMFKRTAAGIITAMIPEHLRRKATRVMGEEASYSGVEKIASLISPERLIEFGDLARQVTADLGSWLGPPPLKDLPILRAFDIEASVGKAARNDEETTLRRLEVEMGRDDAAFNHARFVLYKTAWEVMRFDPEIVLRASKIWPGIFDQFSLDRIEQISYPKLKKSMIELYCQRRRPQFDPYLISKIIFTYSDGYPAMLGLFVIRSAMMAPDDESLHPLLVKPKFRQCVYTIGIMLKANGHHIWGMMMLPDDLVSVMHLARLCAAYSSDPARYLNVEERARLLLEERMINGETIRFMRSVEAINSDLNGIEI